MTADNIPLVVDLDGTLIRTDLLVETAFTYVTQNRFGAVKLASSLARGKAALKEEVASHVEIDATSLPYDARVLGMIDAARKENRQVFLASSSNQRYVRDIAAHLGLFDDCFASSALVNLSADAKAARLTEVFGEMGFDYIGNSRDDLAVWSKARRCIAIEPTRSVARHLAQLNRDVQIVGPDGGIVRPLVKLLRVHQWVKNLLVFAPLAASHTFAPEPVLHATVAFLAFCLSASGVYVLNDLVDIRADRRHMTKRGRPLAAGTFPILLAVPIAFALLGLSLLIAALVSYSLAAVLLGYICLTTAYSFWLKRKMLVDVIALTVLYSIRVVGGGVAISVQISEWLIIFSMFFFCSLALIKRYIELAALADATLPDPENRNYRKDDMDIVASLAAASGLNAVTVFALYVSSSTVHGLYRSPKILWLACPLLMYWLARVLLMAHRRLVHDDPIVFAIRDRNSYFVAALIAAIFLAATFA